MIELNGQRIRLKSIQVTIKQELDTKDASGHSSNTDAAETGIKAKMLTVKGKIPFDAYSHLKRLFSLAEALDGGARQVYRIASRTAETLGVKQVKFSGNIEAVEQENFRQWAITFHLQEHRSVPQKVEERLPKVAATQQGGTGSVAQNSDSPPDTEVPLTGLLGALETLDKALA